MNPCTEAKTSIVPCCRVPQTTPDSARPKNINAKKKSKNASKQNGEKKENKYIKLKIISATAVARVCAREYVCVRNSNVDTIPSTNKTTLSGNCEIVSVALAFHFSLRTCATPHTYTDELYSVVRRSSFAREMRIFFSVWTWWWWEYVYGIAYTHPTDEVVQQARATASSQPEAQSDIPELNSSHYV